MAKTKILEVPLRPGYRFPESVALAAIEQLKFFEHTICPKDIQVGFNNCVILLDAYVQGVAKGKQKLEKVIDAFNVYPPPKGLK